MKAALLQLSVSDRPDENLAGTIYMVKDAVRQGAGFVLTPEVTNCISTSRSHQQEVLQHESDDITLAALRETARETGVWLLIGSLALKTGDADGRFANRSFLVAPDGSIAARYDKIHMFDAQISATEAYRESAGYRPGAHAVTAETPFGKLGLTICYDMRFGRLYQALAAHGAEVLTVPSAFSPVTGAAHWHALLRARAIETGCYVLAPAQTGEHASAANQTRVTYGHSLVVSPWGEVVLDAGKAPGVYPFEIDLGQVAEARRKVPSLANAREFQGP